MTTLFSLRPVFAVDKGNYVNVSASAGQIWSWGGGGGFEKLCVPQILAMPLGELLCPLPPPTLPC